MSDSDVEIEEESEDDCYDDYYNALDDNEIDQTDPRQNDPEYFEFECLSIQDVERLLNECVEALCASLQQCHYTQREDWGYRRDSLTQKTKHNNIAVKVMPSLAKVLLHTHNWTELDVIPAYRQDANKLLSDSRIKPLRPPEVDMQVIRSSNSILCPICLQTFPGEYFRNLSCAHYFCKECWAMHFEIQIMQGVTTGMECMAQGCNILVPEDFALNMLSKSCLRERYQQFAFSDYVRSHPELRYCPGPNCTYVARAKEAQSKRVTCKHCKTSFCFKCGTDYHAPTDCETIKRWLTKCADDSETANYISAHTKDCPKCHICIEKNGGCNHMWENHAKSLRLEEQTLQKIKDRTHQKVMANEGTWIDWQYLLDAAALLAKCRYTLQYTYPYAYYLEAGPRKELFEYQQAQLEAEIENLSWKIERAETTDRGDLENQMDIAEKRRATLLKDFLSV
ncbi:E3 ubiquitin-protein ligase ari-2 isoform X5 [Tachypleus tridentatus]|uniref:E3 ubiquitin-protein ligase ari-2 isoform X5 n=1 Tax=Tachypleus tridentatus TaxID=6853 RepID=UPI003FD6242E